MAKTNKSRVAIYARVSTDQQTTANQVFALKRIAERAGWDVIAEFIDEGISGAKGRESRPAFDELIKACTRREIDIVMCWSVDRLGRSLQHLVGFFEEMRSLGVDLYLQQQSIDTTTPAGKAMFQMVGVFAEFERSMIRERVLEGLERARAQGKQLGRPTISKAKERAILNARQPDEEGKVLGVKRIAKQVGVGVSVVQRVLREAEAVKAA